jgi:digalactosyldiacylglycerol synthase
VRVCGATGAKTRDMPARITDYVPTDEDVGGIFDDKNRARRVLKEKAPARAQAVGGSAAALAAPGAAAPGAGSAPVAASGQGV